MSESQLKKQLAENQTLTQQWERSKSIIKTSVACQEYVKNAITHSLSVCFSLFVLTHCRMVEYVTKQPDPFIPGYSGNENPWHTNPGGGLCIVI